MGLAISSCSHNEGLLTILPDHVRNHHIPNDAKYRAIYTNIFIYDILIKKKIRSCGHPTVYVPKREAAHTGGGSQ